jgi:hypothetical protein
MTINDTRTAPPLEDVRVEVARKALAELPDASDNEEPYYWIGRLKTAMEQLLDVAAPAPGGLDAGQREVLASALADASGYREGRASDNFCADCEADPAGLCPDHAADLDLHDAYVGLAAGLGLELQP